MQEMLASFRGETCTVVHTDACSGKRSMEHLQNCRDTVTVSTDLLGSVAEGLTSTVFRKVGLGQAFIIRGGACGRVQKQIAKFPSQFGGSAATDSVLGFPLSENSELREQGR